METVGDLLEIDAPDRQVNEERAEQDSGRQFLFHRNALSKNVKVRRQAELAFTGYLAARFS